MYPIDREKQRGTLEALCQRPGAQIALVSGRLGLGKTELVESFFGNALAFKVTGKQSAPRASQLKAFSRAFADYSGGELARPFAGWPEAFEALSGMLMEKGDELREPAYGRIVVFFDESHRLDTVRSSFWEGFSDFFSRLPENSDVIVVFATSDTLWAEETFSGPLNRICSTHIRLEPMTLAECRAFHASRGFSWSMSDEVDAYLAFGGVQAYHGLLYPAAGAAGSIKWLDKAPLDPLGHAFSEIETVISQPAGHPARVLSKIAATPNGCSRNELLEDVSLPSGQTLTQSLSVLLSHGLIREYRRWDGKQHVKCFQVSDPFTWMMLTKDTMDKKTRMRHASDNLLLSHTGQIKQALGISGVDTEEYPWFDDRGIGTRSGKKIDLVIERADGKANLCFPVLEEELSYDAYLEMLDLSERFSSSKSSRLTAIMTPVFLYSEGYVIEYDDVCPVWVSDLMVF